MLFAIPLLISALIYAAAALLPAYFLMRYIYRMDRVEKEPVKLLFSLVIHTHTAFGFTKSRAWTQNTSVQISL